jgi:MFS family permease
MYFCHRTKLYFFQMANTSFINSTYTTEQYQKINIITGWIVFGIASLTYLLTIESTASFWDCGEFIASAYKLEVGHPPGAPLFMIISKVFTLFAGGDVTHVAIMVNSMSALASGFTILFLFWSITYFAQKIINKKEQEYSSANILGIIGSGVVGALAYTFSDTFWFSAVEGEVYALSSFFTAVVFWAVLKWEHVSDEKYSNRWLVLIAYLMGLSIGVHLLNLLAIPAIVFVYYFKKYKFSGLGLFYASIISIAILGSVMYGVIPGVVKVASWFELMFVNSFGLPFNSGIVFYIILLLGLIIFGIYFSHKNGYVLTNTILISIAVMLIGYSSYAMIVIRASADTPMNENRPDNVFSLLSYLNREQYGDRPLLYGQYFNAQIIEEKTDSTYTQRNGKYEKIPMTNPDYKYDPKFSTIFPRMYSHQDSHITAYQNFANITDKTQKPSFIQNLVFFFGYQVNHMYIRYFMWNFAGRQNDEQSYGGNLKGNWISGIPFVDAIRLGSQKNLPNSIKSNKAHNKYYFLPLLLGIIGLIYFYQRQPKQFLVVLLLFVFTGLAIVVYLNQTPYQPRERDYAYAGSFYAFAIFIGLGVLAIANWLKRLTKPIIASSIASILTLVLVPGIMAKENWNDHDRSGRYTARDLAKNYLSSCAHDAILFTFGDNDTFPLWYVQEVEGFRTDIRVVNLSLLGTDWYINQMKKRAYDSDPVPFSYTSDKYIQGTRDIVPVVERSKEVFLLKQIMDFVGSDDQKTKVETQGGDFLNYVPATNVAIIVDSLKAIHSGLVKPELVDSMVKFVQFKITNQYLTKSNMMVLDLVANFNWDRPVYFALSVGKENYMNLQDYFRLEGFAYRLIPIKTVNPSGDVGYVDTDILYDNLMNKFVWGRMNEPDVLIDENVLRVISIMKIREVFYRLADALIVENKTDKALKVLDKMMILTPNSQIPYDYLMIPVAEAYYRTNHIEKANQIINIMADMYSDDLNYYLNFKGTNAALSAYESKVAMSILQELMNLTEKYKQEKQYKSLSAKFEALLQRYMSSPQSK